MIVENSLFKNTPIPLAVLDTNTAFVDFSDSWSVNFGHTVDMVGKPIFEYLPELPQELKSDVLHCLNQDDHRSGESRIILEDGDAVWYHWKVKSINDEGEGITGIILVLEDTTDKKLEEDLLVKSQQVARIGGWELDLVNNKIYWSKITREIHEVKDNFEPDLETGILFYKEGYSRETISRLVNEAIEYGRSWDTELQIVTTKNKEIWVRAIGEPEMINGKCVRIAGTFQDIDKRKKIELQLEKSEESLQGAFENSSVGMALVGVDGKFINVNQSLCDSLGYSSEELLQLTFQDITHPDDLEIDLSLLNEVVEGKRSTYQIEKRYFDKNGQVVYALLTVTSVKKFDGSLSHFISQIVDISPRIKAERKMKNLLQLTTNQNSSLLNFAHIVSHNLRSNAANLAMICKFLSEDGLTPEEQKEMIQMLNRASNGLNETISHLNDVVQVKLETGKKLKDIHLRKTVDKILEDVNALILENKINVNINIPKDHMVKGVPAYLESIVLNLITNAIKYRDLEKQSSITIGTHEADQFRVLYVEDNGRGIDLDRFGKKIFGMYKTFHGNKDARGIGLFITKNQIESMGGSIDVESEISVGTKFKVKLIKA